MPFHFLTQSPQIRQTPWHEVADMVEAHLFAKAEGYGYALRLPPAEDDAMPLYDTVQSTVRLTVGVRVTSRLADGTRVAVTITDLGDEWVEVEVVPDGGKPASRHYTRTEFDAVLTPWTTVDDAAAWASAIAADIISDPDNEQDEDEETEKSLTEVCTTLHKLVRPADDSTQPLARVNDPKLIQKALRLLKRARKNDSAAQAAFASIIAQMANTGANPGPFIIAKGARGPQGVPVGTISVHANGERWERTADGWTDRGKGTDEQGGKKLEKVGGDGGGEEDDQSNTSIEHQQAEDLLARLRDRYDITTDTRERAAIAQQIALLRNRIASMRKVEAVGSPPASAQDKSKQVRERSVDENKDVAKSAHEALLGFREAMFGDLRRFMQRTNALTPADALAELAASDDVIAQKDAAAFMKSADAGDRWATLERWMR